MAHVFRLIIWLLLCALLTGDPSFAKVITDIDISEGEIDGRVAIAFLPTKGFESREVMAPAGFEVRLAPVEALDQEMSHPAGEWFQVPPGKYKYWLEGDGWMTPYTSVLRYGAEPFRGKGIAGVVPVVPAGVLVLDPEIETGSTIELRVLHLDSHNRAPFPQKEMSRRVAGGLAHAGVRMPEGPVLAALYDRKAKEYVAISKPVDVEAHEETHVRPVPPEEYQCDFLVRLERPSFIDKFSGYDIEPLVKIAGGKPLKPDQVVPTADRVYAVWYALDAGLVTLEVDSPSVFVPPQEIVLRSGKVEAHYGRMQRLPKIDVSLDLPSALPETDELTLELFLDEPGGKKVREVNVPRGGTSVVVEKVPARALSLILKSPPWRFKRTADMSDGVDSAVVFDPQPIEVVGTVYLGEERHSGVIEFETNREGDVFQVATDEQGDYEAALFRPGHYVVHVLLGDVATPPYVELLDHPLTEDTTLDFHVPDTDFRVRVVDAVTAKGIPGARVAAGNEFASVGGSPLREPGRRKTVVQRLETGEDGTANLQPLHPGLLTLTAQAEGYLKSDPRREEIEDGHRPREVTIVLEPVREMVALEVLLPDGHPAAGAMISLQDTLGNVKPTWTGRTDSSGSVSIPRQEAGALVLVRHEEAGCLISGPSVLHDRASWTLPPPAIPLSIAVERPWGDPARWAQIALWIGDHLVSGRTLAWLFGTSVADQEGFWQARNLPVAPVRVVAWPSGEELAPRDLDAVSTVVPHPWPEVVSIETIH